MNQDTSLFFRLPRELRDEVYVHYVLEERGYAFEPKTETLRKTDGHPIDLSFGYTCKLIAEEMDGLALRVNQIHFKTLFELPGGIDQPSTAFLYDRLLEERAAHLRRMLSLAYTLVSSKAMRALRMRDPLNNTVRVLEQIINEEGNDYLRGGYLHHIHTLDNSADESIIQDLVQIIATDPRFEHMISAGHLPESADTTIPGDSSSTINDYGDSSSDEEDSGSSPPLYTKDTQYKILQWKPAHWWIPNGIDLNTVAEFLPVSPETSTYDHSGRECRPKYYFSAAAVAIRFLNRLDPKTQAHLRKVIIQEDNPSVAMPMTHAQGFLPLCRANPKLHVERRVDIWRIDLIPNSRGFNRNDYTRHTLLRIAIWIQEAKLLHQMGMPIDSFSLVLHGPSPQASQQLSDGMINAAIWHEGAAEIARREKTDFFHFRHGVAEDFVDVIKEMVKGDIPVKFDADMGDLWDLEQLLTKHEGRWPAEIRHAFDLTTFEEPDGGWEAARNTYVEHIDWADRMDGWNVLMATA